MWAESSCIKEYSVSANRFKEERAFQVVVQRNQKRMEAIEKEQEKEDKAQENQLFVINGAKVKFGPHIGTFKVLSDTPTI